MVNEKPLEGFLGMLFKRNMLVMGILLGLFFVWIGNVVFTISYPLTSSNMTGIKLGIFLNSLGFAGITMFLLGGGFLNKSFDKYIRMIMIISGVIVLIMTLVVSL